MSTARYNYCLLLLLVVGIVAGCTTVRDLYFQTRYTGPKMVGEFELRPRVFSFQDKKVTEGAVYPNDFAVSVRVQLPDERSDVNEWEQGEERITKEAIEFLERAQSVFWVDSLILFLYPDSLGSIVLEHDQANYSPRRDDYFTLQFGRVEIPKVVPKLRAVLKFRRTDDPTETDSLYWFLDRVDKTEGSLAAFRQTVRGY